MEDVLNLIASSSTTLPSLISILESEQAALTVLKQKWSDRQDSDLKTFTSLRSHLTSLSQTISSLLHDIETIETDLNELENDASRSALEKVTLELREAEKKVAYLSNLRQVTDVMKEVETCNVFGKAVVAPMKTLQEIKESLHPNMHLFKRIEEGQAHFRAKLHGLLTKELKGCIKTLDWPTTPFLQLKLVNNVEQALVKFQECLKTAVLLDMVTPGEQTFESVVFRSLADPLVLRLKFHFQSSRPTNRIDKPEWFLTHVQNLFQTHSHFLDKRVNSLLSKRDAQQLLWKNGIQEWMISKLITDFYHCFKAYSALRQPKSDATNDEEMETSEEDEKIQVWVELVHHLALQIALFDEKSSSSCHFEATIFSDFFGQSEIFEKWLDMEQSYASNSYKTMMNRDDAWSIPLEGSPLTSSDCLYCPCNSATALLIQFESISQFYHHLKSIDQHILLFDATHASLLEQYLTDTEYELEKWPVPAFARFSLFQTSSKPKHDVEGCMKAWSCLHASLSHLELAMRKWSDSPVFLAMAETKYQNLNDTIFDDILASYLSVRDQITSNVVMCLTDEAFMHWRQYERRKSWLSRERGGESETEDDSGVFDDDAGPSPLLYTGLTTLSRRLDLVKKYFGSDFMDVGNVLKQMLRNKFDAWFKNLGESEQLDVDRSCLLRILE